MKIHTKNNILRHNLEIIPKLVAMFRSPTASFIRLVVTWCWCWARDQKKIQYLVNWSFAYQCRMSSFTTALSLPSSSASLSCAVGLATYSAEAPPRMHQISPFSDKKSKHFLGKRSGPLPRPLFQWGGRHPLPRLTLLGASTRAFGARTPQL